MQCFPRASETDKRKMKTGRQTQKFQVVNKHRLYLHSPQVRWTLPKWRRDKRDKEGGEQDISVVTCRCTKWLYYTHLCVTPLKKKERENGGRGAKPIQLPPSLALFLFKDTLKGHLEKRETQQIMPATLALWGPNYTWNCPTLTLFGTASESSAHAVATGSSELSPCLQCLACPTEHFITGFIVGAIGIIHLCLES